LNLEEETCANVLVNGKAQHPLRVQQHNVQAGIIACPHPCTQSIDDKLQKTAEATENENLIFLV